MLSVEFKTGEPLLLSEVAYLMAVKQTQSEIVDYGGRGYVHSSMKMGNSVWVEWDISALSPLPLCRPIHSLPLIHVIL
jgi:hypothetical protein